MFHFPTFPPTTLYIQLAATVHNYRQVSPFGHPRINVRLPTPRGLSQATTSFIGSCCQGIHRLHLQTYPTQTKDTRVYYTVLNQQPTLSPIHPHRRPRT